VKEDVSNPMNSSAASDKLSPSGEVQGEIGGGMNFYGKWCLNEQYRA